MGNTGRPKLVEVYRVAPKEVPPTLWIFVDYLKTKKQNER